MKFTNASLALCITMGATSGAVHASDTDWMITPTEKYDQILESSKNSPAGAFAVEAEAALNSNRYERAIQLSRKSILKNPDDIDTHRILAEGLEMKYRETSDQSVLRECLGEYIKVMGGSVGEEKGLTVLGPGLLASLYGADDSERYVLAKTRIKQLTGSLPRPWETTNAFLKRVIKPSVSGKLLTKIGSDK